VATDPEGDESLTYTIAQDPLHGTVSINEVGFNGTDYTYTYKPGLNFFGTDSFQYTVRDSLGAEATYTITIVVNPVNDQPTASDVFVATDEDTPLESELPLGIDVDEGDAATYTLAEGGGPAHGTVDINPDGTYLYTPDANFSGPDRFSYTIDDRQGGQNTYTVYIDVNPVNDAPELTGQKADLPDGYQGTAYIVSAIDLLQGYSDVDFGDTLTVQNLSAGDGFEVIDNGNDTFTIRSLLNHIGAVQLTYQVSDGAAFVEATQTFTLGNANQPPELTGDKATLASGSEDNAYTVSATDLLQGFTDAEGSTLTVRNLSAGNGFRVITNGNGTFTITPPLNYNGAVNLTYQVSDGVALVGATQTFTLAPVNDAPVGKDNTVTINEDSPYALKVSDFGFADVDLGDSFGAVTITALPSDGTLTLNGEAVQVGQVISIADMNAGQLVFTPGAKERGPAYASFTFQVADQSGLRDAIPRTLTVDVVSINSVTALSRREISNEGFEANKKIEELLRLRALNEAAKDAYHSQGITKAEGAHPKSRVADALYFAAPSRALVKETSDTERLDGTKQKVILRNVATPPNPVTDRQGHIVYQLPEGVFKGGLGLIKYIATKRDGSPLPAWITFDSKTGKLTAEVPKEMKAPLEIKVEAVDSRGYKAETTLKVYPRPDKMSFTGKHTLSAQFKNAFHLAP
jgi:VCBS repeat-containing protein